MISLEKAKGERRKAKGERRKAKGAMNRACENVEPFTFRL